MHIRWPRSYWHSAGAGCSTSTILPHRHILTRTPGAVILQMDGTSRLSTCRQHTDVGRVDTYRPTAASPPYTAQTGWVDGLIHVELHMKERWWWKRRYHGGHSACGRWGMTETSPARDCANHMTPPATAATSHDWPCRMLPTSWAVSAWLTSVSSLVTLGCSELRSN